jgi:uncharacterized membrane protein
MSETRRSRFTVILLLAIAVVVPLAGLVLALMQATEGERAFALRLGAAAVLGACLYALLLT